MAPVSTLKIRPGAIHLFTVNFSSTSMFNRQELKILIGGVEEPVDIEDLKNNCIYGGVYDPDHLVIQRFWKVAKTLDQNERQLLLRFVTSCSRPPLL